MCPAASTKAITAVDISVNVVNDLLPRSCLLCGRRLGPDDYDAWQPGFWRPAPVCSVCRTTLHTISSPQRCLRCSAPLPQFVAECERCRRTSYHFTRHVAVCVYEGTAAALIRSYKFRANRSLGTAMARLMAAAAEHWLQPGTIVVPVPSRSRSRRRRGFDAVATLASCLGELTSVRPTQLLARRGRSEQKALSYEQRMENVACSFHLRRGAEVPAEPMILVDDVFTTGATLSACAGVLLEAGAEDVECLTFAMEL